MSALLPIKCCALSYGDCKREGKIIVFVGKRAYGVCDECWKLATKVRQLLLK